MNKISNILTAFLILALLLTACGAGGDTYLTQSPRVYEP